MDNLGITLILAMIVMGFVIAGLGIGYLITGKNRLKKGCGRLPDQKDESSCSLCGSKKTCEPEGKDEHHPH